MKNKINVLFAAITLFAAASCQKEDNTPSSSSSVSGEVYKNAAPVRNTEAVPFLDFIQDYNYMTPASDTALIFEALAHNPITAPDGHQLTLGEFLSVSGRASIKCINAGTHVVLNLHGLVPNGVYSIFVSTFDAPGFTPTLEFMTADGVIGVNDGSQNTFTADVNGDASISAIVPEGALSEFGSVSSCLRDNFQVIFSAIYHIDGINHGPEPGPAGTWAFPFGFVFQN